MPSSPLHHKARSMSKKASNMLTARLFGVECTFAWWRAALKDAYNLDESGDANQLTRLSWETKGSWNMYPLHMPPIRECNWTRAGSRSVLNLRQKSWSVAGVFGVKLSNDSNIDGFRQSILVARHSASLNPSWNKGESNVSSATSAIDWSGEKTAVAIKLIPCLVHSFVHSTGRPRTLNHCCRRSRSWDFCVSCVWSAITCKSCVLVLNFKFVQVVHG